MPYVNTNRSYVLLSDEDAWGDEGGASPNTDLIPVMDGDYNVALDDPTRDQPHVQGNQSAYYPVQDVRNLRGPFRVGLWPHNWQRLLSWGIDRSSGETASKAAHYVVPGIETRLHAGLKPDTLTIEGSEGGDVTMSLDLIGKHENTDSEPTYPGTLTIPEVPSLLFKNCRFVISLDAGSTFGNRIVPTGLRQFNISVNNNHKIGTAIEDRVNGYLDGTPEFCVAGRQQAECRFTAAFDRADYGALQRDRLYAQFKLVAAHPSYTSYATVAAGATAGSAVEVTLGADPSAFFTVNDYVLFDNAGGANLPCVGKITTITPAAPSITIDVLDEDVAIGDHVFAAGLEIKTARMLVSSSNIQKAFDDFLRVEIVAQPFSAASAQVTYKALDLTLPT